MGTVLAMAQLVREQLFAHHDIIEGTSDSGTVATCVDATLISALVTSRNYVGSWLYMESGLAAGETSRISAFNRANGTLTVSPAYVGGAVATDPYNIYFGFHPDHLRESVKKAVELGTRGAVAASALSTDASSQAALPDDAVVQGALHFIRQIQSRSLSGDGRQEALDLSREHLENFRQMCEPFYGEINFGDRRPVDSDPVGRFS